MCSSYGLDPDAADVDVPLDLPPLDERGNRESFARWAQRQASSAKITGRRARNLNPLIRIAEGRRRLDEAWWWLHVGGGPAPFSAFNARDDRLTRSWSGSFRGRRAILPATWYVEKGVRFRLPSGPVFGVAAIYATTPLADGGELVSYAMVTRDALAAAAEVHPRMPLVLPREFHDEWLDPEVPGTDDLVARARAASDPLCRTVIAQDRSRPPTLFDEVEAGDA